VAPDDLWSTQELQLAKSLSDPAPFVDLLVVGNDLSAVLFHQHHSLGTA
jgi:hypothetical protein